MAISFHYQIPGFKIESKKKIIAWILLVTYLERKEVADINYVFCNDEFLLQLNNKFLQHKTYTDILTFDYSSEREINAEIYISIERVKENAVSFDSAFKKELQRVMIHGVLHCIGYSDNTEQARRVIRNKENHYLKLLLEMK